MFLLWWFVFFFLGAFGCMAFYELGAWCDRFKARRAHMAPNRRWEENKQPLQGRIGSLSDL